MIAEHEQDPATAVAYIQRLFLTKALADTVWGWFVVQAQGLSVLMSGAAS